MILMKLGNMTGDSKIVGKDGWIVLNGCEVSTSREVLEGGKAGTANVNLGVAELGPISVAKPLDRSSSDLFLQSISGAALPRAEIEFIAMVKDRPQVYLRYTLDQPTVASWSLSAEEDDEPSEEATIWYQKILMESFTYDNTGKQTGSHTAGWDRIKNTRWTG